VQKHGEVFTPRWMIEKMLDTPGVKEACERLRTTFLEPAAGEGAFLTAILERKLLMVAKKYSETIEQYENHALFALTTIYGIELLEDNSRYCVMNMYRTFFGAYSEQVSKHESKKKKKVLDSANVIIKANNRLGNLLTRKNLYGEPIIITEWKPVSLKTKSIKVNRTEYSLDEIFDHETKQLGSIAREKVEEEQMSLFDLFEVETKETEESKDLRYATCKIVDIYKEEMEEYDGQDDY